MAQIGNLFDGQTLDGTSDVFTINEAHKNLKIEGTFDGAIIKIETTFFGITWVVERDGGGNDIVLTSPDNLNNLDQAIGTKIRLVLSNAGAGTNITAGIY